MNPRLGWYFEGTAVFVLAGAAYAAISGDRGPALFFVAAGALMLTFARHHLRKP